MPMPPEEATIIFSMTLPATAMPRVSALVDDLMSQVIEQGYAVSAVLTDSAGPCCPLCGQRLEHLDDLHQH